MLRKNRKIDRLVPFEIAGALDGTEFHRGDEMYAEGCDSWNSRRRKRANGREEEARGASLSFSLRHDFSTVLTKTRIKPDQLDRAPTTPHNSSFVRS